MRILLFLFLSFNAYSQVIVPELRFFNADLKCSANGTEIFYANNYGVASSLFFTKQLPIIKGHFLSSNKTRLIDKKSKVTIKPLYLPSFGSNHDDIVKKALELQQKGEDNVYLMIMQAENSVEINRTKLIDPTSFDNFGDRILKIKSFYDYANIAFSAIDLKLAGDNWRKAMMDPISIGKALEAVSDKHIDESAIPNLKNNVKGIYLAHGVGTQLVEVVARKIRDRSVASQDTAFRDYVKYNGSVYVAGAPSSFLKNETLNYFRDSYVYDSSLNSNYTNSNDLRGVIYSFDKIFFNQSNDAYRIGTNEDTRPLAWILDEKIYTIAQKLEDNCGIPVIALTTTDATVDETGVYQVLGKASLDRTIQLNVKDANPYHDGSRTTFEWKIIRNYPQYTGKQFQGAVEYKNGLTGSDYQLEIPYRDVTYDVVVTATYSPESISTKTFRFAVKENQAPVLSIASQACVPPNSDGYTDGTAVFNLQVNDDQYRYDGSTYQYSTAARSYDYSISDGVSTSAIPLVNTCPVIGPVYHYQYEISCQKTAKYYYCYYEPGCTQEQLNDTTMVNTGVQFTSVLVFDEKDRFIKSIGLADMWEGSGLAGFYDLNNPGTVIYAPYSCPSGF